MRQLEVIGAQQLLALASAIAAAIINRRLTRTKRRHSKRLKALERVAGDDGTSPARVAGDEGPAAGQHLQ